MKARSKINKSINRALQKLIDLIMTQKLAMKSSKEGRFSLKRDAEESRFDKNKKRCLC